MNATTPRDKHKTEQSVGTPREFIDAVERRFGSLEWDLAADSTNAKCECWWGEDDDSLSKPWAERLEFLNLWLNPPFKDIAPWARKCALESPRQRGLILALWPASVGSVWFAEHVRDHAYSLALSPRLTFAGHSAPFPKDLMLSVYGYGLRGFDTWRWKP